MNSILVFISSKAFNSPPRQTTASADPLVYLSQEIKWWTDDGDTQCDFDDALMDFAEGEEFVNVDWLPGNHIIHAWEMMR